MVQDGDSGDGSRLSIEGSCREAESSEAALKVNSVR